jgi:hypothetical protein
VTSTQPGEKAPAPAAPQVAQSGEDDTKASGEDDTKAVEEEAEAFPPETLTDRAGVETLRGAEPSKSFTIRTVVRTTLSPAFS